MLGIAIAGVILLAALLLVAVVGRKPSTGGDEATTHDARPGHGSSARAA
jgi:hypothetical protein